MAEIIEMPKLSDTMTTGTLVKWLKKEGDSVSNGDALAEVETDKATMELESFDDGVLLKQYVGEGESVDVGAPVCAIGEKDEKAPDAGGSSSSSSDSKEEPAEKEEEPAGDDSEDQDDSDNQKNLADQNDRVKASPLARKIASENNLDLSSVKGSGPRGRVVKADVETALKRGAGGDGVKEISSGKSASSGSAQGFTPFAEDKKIPLSNMRSAIARRLLESKTTIPHFYLEIEVDADPLLKLRSGLNAQLAELSEEQGKAKFSVNLFVLKAATEALRRVPAANASWEKDHILQHGSVHMAFAVAVDDGLVTPVIRDAHAKTLRQMNIDSLDLIQKAKNKKLKPDEMSGSTFTVTNLGMFGIQSFFGIINPPNAAILSVGATIKKPIVDDKTGEIRVGQRMTLGLSADHRVVDGAVGAEFLAELKKVLETPAAMLV